MLLFEQTMIYSEAPLHVCKATEPPAVEIREINLRSCRRESNPRLQHDERASYPLGHRGCNVGQRFKMAEQVFSPPNCTVDAVIDGITGSYEFVGNERQHIIGDQTVISCRS